MTPLCDVALVVLVGIGATAVMDLWLMLLRLAGVRPPDFALVGRWVGHLPRGRFAHAAIAEARPLQGELVLGWLTHYAVGIAFAGLLVAVEGMAWLREPSFLPALLVGASTVAAPLFVMQPAMGGGFAASRTTTPVKNCLRSLANHAVFGAGLYLSGAAAALVLR